MAGVRVGIAGASGYSGAELLRLLLNHPGFEPIVATSREFAGRRVGEVYPNLQDAGALTYTSLDSNVLREMDLVFLALPHGASMSIGAELATAGVRVVDFSADFRLLNASLYDTWYGTSHTAPEWLGKWVYGLPELYRDELRGAALVANPGCYPTAAALALAPLLAAGMISPSGLVVSAASGVSGAGRGLSNGLHFSHVDASFKAYSAGTHKHTPEIEQTLARFAPDTSVTFVPHLVPMTRGLLATCVARTASSKVSENPAEVLKAFYANEPFVHAVSDPPETKFLTGSNGAHVWATADTRTGTVISVCAIDNLGKGAAGQALQNANLMCGFDEITGLVSGGVYP
ncbi:MAG: N-acetyl-gamma-glutamyl-phosphate reductase [Actinomycetota bacterium]